MKRGRIVETNIADENHVVHTIKGHGGKTYRRLPCSDCPWRVDAVGVFPPEAFVISAGTGADGGRAFAAGALGPAFHTFACHQSGTDRPATCAGYILRGDQAIGWRLAAATGKFDPAQVSDAGVALHDNYFEMAVANGVPEDAPALDHCRPWRRRRQRLRGY